MKKLKDENMRINSSGQIPLMEIIDGEVENYTNEEDIKYNIDKNENDKETSGLIPNKKFVIHKIFFVFIFSLIFTICFLIFYIVKYNIRKFNFQIIPIFFDNSLLNNREYELYHFDNGLEVLIIQDKNFDMDGGALAIENGYMDDPYNQGLSQLSINIIDDLFKNNLDKIILTDYYGNYAFKTEEYFSFFSFNILNGGFIKFLEQFSKILNVNLEEISKKNMNYFRTQIELIDSNYYTNNFSLSYRERHLLEYLVYGINNTEGEDILPEGNIDLIDHNIKFFRDNTKEIISQIINPSKIKFILFSKYKRPITSKYMKKYFSYLTKMSNKTKENNTNNIQNKNQFYDNMNFSLKQMISFVLGENETSFIDIIFYIDKINSESYNDLYIKEKYFNYIADFFIETKNNSLYDILTNSKDFSIKSLYAYSEVVLKSKIKFTINIGLGIYSYENLNDIIFLTYQYINKIVEEAIGKNFQEERYKEILEISKQRLSFTEKSFGTMDIAKNNVKNMFYCENNYKYFLYQTFIPENDDFEIIKNETFYYFSQLVPEKSIVVIGIRNSDIPKIKCDNSSFFKINCTKFFNKDYFSWTKYYNLFYSKDILNTDFVEFFNIDSIGNISFTPNKYLSKYKGLIEIDKNDINNSPEKIYTNGSISNFFYQKDSTFRIPKAFISINLMHPFLRPTNNEQEVKNCYYFQIIEMFIAIIRKIKFELADAERAGNTIAFGYNEDNLYIHVNCFEDICYKIVKTIKGIIIDYDWRDSDFITRNELYKYEAFDDFFDYIPSIDNIAKNYFYGRLKNYLFNRFEFFPYLFDYESCIKSKAFNVDHLNKFIIYGFIYGYYDRNKSIELANLFDRPEIDKLIIEQLLININNKTNLDNYTSWISEIHQLDRFGGDFAFIDFRIIDKTIANLGYKYVHIYNYDKSNFIKSSLAEIIFNNRNYTNDNIYFSSLIIYRDIYYEFGFYEPNDAYVYPNNNSNLNQTIVNAMEGIIDLYSKKVDYLGDKFYYLKKNFGLTLSTKFSTLENKAIETLDSLFYYKKNKNTIIEKEEYEKLVENLDCSTLINEFKSKILTGNNFDVNTYPIYDK